MLRNKEGFKYTYLFPLILCLGLAVTVIITYSMSLSSHHIRAVFPYISDTGTWPPESCIFSLMIFFLSIILLCINYIRYKQVCIYCETVAQNDRKWKIAKLNKAALWCGFVSCFGMVMVASFQETNIFWVHVVGANNAFGVGCAFQWLQTVISWYLYPEKGTRNAIVAKITLAVISTICFLSVSICGLLALLKFKGDNLTLWSMEDGGYKLHLTSTITEWILSIATMLHFVTYINELKEVIVMDIVVIELV
ncbi:DNA damage-regulated autophagy modulator protein 2-like [Rhynchophorus ferrugineus]|uniref:DNA damage-regulated autophagy modulator protein 2-like n=1 Tax=Rhynchophorus ferrugineus TaxID=354439 RepID=UPI003FCE4EAF